MCVSFGLQEQPWKSRDVTHQEELYGPQDVHGSSVCGPQVETDPNRTAEFWAQGARNHVVGASGCKGYQSVSSQEKFVGSKTVKEQLIYQLVCHSTQQLFDVLQCDH